MKSGARNGDAMNGDAVNISELDLAALAELQYELLSLEQREAVIRELHARLLADPAAAVELIARRDVDHDLQRLLRPQADDARFIQGVLTEVGRNRIDTGTFVRVVARRARAQRRRANWTAFGLPIAALLFVSVGMWWAMSGTAQTETLAAPAELAAADLRITAGTGKVRRGTGEMPATVGLDLRSEDLVIADAGMHMTYADGSRLELAAGTRVQLQRLTEGGGRQLSLESGELEAEIIQQQVGRPLVLNTKAARYEVERAGTRFFVRAEEQSSLVRMQAGEIRVIRRRDGNVSVVRSGETAVSSLAPPIIPESETETESKPEKEPENTSENEAWRERHPEWIWCDDFEQDRSGDYCEVDHAEGNFTREPHIGMGGSYGMRVISRPGVTDAGSLKLAFGRMPSGGFRPVDAGTAVYRDIYWRMYLRCQTNWRVRGDAQISRAMVFANGDWAQAALARIGIGGDRGLNLLLDPASGTDALGALQTVGYNDMARLRWLGAVATTTPIFAPGQADTWYTVETHIRLNDPNVANGVFEVWIDGKQEARITELDWLGSFDLYGINAVFIENGWKNGAPQLQERYVDNFVVSTAPIGLIDVQP